MSEFNLFDEIEDGCVNDAIAFLKEHQDEDVVLNIDSVGGDVFAGLRLCQAIQNHKGKVTAKCGIVVASISSVIALSCDSIVITKDTFFMLHQPWATAQGTADEIKSTASLLDKACFRIKEIVEEKAVNKKELSVWFSGETWMGYKEILDNFQNVVLSNNTVKLTNEKMTAYAKFNNKPKALMELVEKAKNNKYSASDIEYINSVMKKADAILLK